MAKTYESGGLEEQAMLRSVMERHHRELIECGARGAVILTGDPEGVPVKFHGVESVAKVRKTSGRERADNAADFQVELDAQKWANRPETQKRAILDEYLSYLEAVKEERHGEDGEGAAFKTDALGRPVLRVLPPDFLAAGNAAVIERWGEDAPCYQAVMSAHRRARQAVASFRDNAATAPAEVSLPAVPAGVG